MGARDYWERMLVYFGITEEHDDIDDHDTSRGRRSPVADDEWDDAPPAASGRGGRGRRGSAASAASGGAAPRGMRQTAAGVGVVPPRTFNDAQSIADQYKRGVPVIVNLQQTDSDLAKRLIDFASGLTYGLDGGMQRIADKVFLLTPANVEVSAEERAAMLDSGFFNES